MEIGHGGYICLRVKAFINASKKVKPSFRLPRKPVTKPATETTQILLRCQPHLEDLLDEVNRVKLANLERRNHEVLDSFEDGIAELVSSGRIL